MEIWPPSVINRDGTFATNNTFTTQLGYQSCCPVCSHKYLWYIHARSWDFRLIYHTHRVQYSTTYVPTSTEASTYLQTIDFVRYLSILCAPNSGCGLNKEKDKIFYNFCQFILNAELQQEWAKYCCQTCHITSPGCHMTCHMTYSREPCCRCRVLILCSASSALAAVSRCLLATATTTTNFFKCNY